ncbi:MAG: Zn-ribbon domain-containing OB-fold protein [Candidatus Bathyarchaeia archaeon]
MEGEGPSIEGFYRKCSAKTLYLARCGECKSVFGSPRTICPRCGSRGLAWIPSKGLGRLITWTVIHVAPPGFQEKAPYVMGVVELEGGGRLLSIIEHIEPEKLRMGLKLKINYHESCGEEGEWPRWPRYYFEPVDEK